METKTSCVDCGVEIVDVWSISLLPENAPDNYGVVAKAGVRCVACHRACNAPAKVAERQAVIDAGRQMQAANRKAAASKQATAPATKPMRRRSSAWLQRLREERREQERLDRGGHPWVHDEE